MPKPEAGSAKALSNAMKARGLQKLKFYCEMCKKQCRDDNAFKVLYKLIKNGENIIFSLCFDNFRGNMLFFHIIN